MIPGELEPKDLSIIICVCVNKVLDVLFKDRKINVYSIDNSLYLMQD